MFLSIGLLILLALIFGPSLWVKFVMKRYSKEKPEMPGTGGELAEHLIERFTLKDVKVEVTELGDHYDPVEKKVRLLREHYESKSLTAVAIAAHEVGHAIQDQQGDKRLATRTKMIPVADKVARWSAAMIWQLLGEENRDYVPGMQAPKGHEMDLARIGNVIR